MFKYRCSSRNNLLFVVDGQIKELRPNEEIILKTKIDHPYLQLLVPKAVDTVSNPSKTKVKSNATRNRSV